MDTLHHINYGTDYLNAYEIINNTNINNNNPIILHQYRHLGTSLLTFITANTFRCT